MLGQPRHALWWCMHSNLKCYMNHDKSSEDLLLGFSIPPCAKREVESAVFFSPGTPRTITNSDYMI